MARIVVNKHTNIPSGITQDSFINQGEIVISNKVGEEDIYVVNSESGVTGIRKSSNELILALSGAVYYDYPTTQELNDAIDVAVEEVKDYSDANDNTILSSAVTYTNEVKTDLLDVIHNITSASSASYDSIIAKFDDYATSADTVNAIDSAKNESKEYTNEQVDDAISIIMDVQNALRESISNVSGTVNTFSASTIAEIGELSGSVWTIVSGAPETFDTIKEIADWIEEHSGETIDIQADIAKLQEDLTDLSASTETILPAAKNYSDSEINKLSGSVKTISGSIVTEIHQLSAGTEDAIATLTDYVDDEVSDAIAEAKDYTDDLSGNVSTAITILSGDLITYVNDAIEGQSTDLTELSGSVVSIGDEVELLGDEISDLEGDLSELSGGVITLSGDVATAIADAEENARDYTDEKIEDVSEALSGVSAATFTALQNVRFEAIEESEYITQRNVRVKKDGTDVIIDVSGMDIDCGDY